MDMTKVGVVIINEDYFTSRGLAALQWARGYLAGQHKKPKRMVRILLVQVSELQNNATGEEPALLNYQMLKGIALSKAEKESNVSVPAEWGICLKKIHDKDHDLKGKSYQGLDIAELLEAAIKKFKLDTLVLGMEAVGSIKKKIHLQLETKCSVVLVTTDSKAQTTDPEAKTTDPEAQTTFIISPAAGAPGAVVPSGGGRT